jgi:hypothetical protein
VAFEGTTSALVEEGLRHLSDYVVLERKLYLPAVSPQTEKRNQSMLVLDYYRNQVLHLFNIEVRLKVNTLTTKGCGGMCFIF